MDILFWTKLNPNVRVSGVSRSFYGSYFYKLEITVTGATMLRSPEIPISEQIKARQANRTRNVNWGGSWMQSRLRDPSLSDVALLESILSTKEQFSDKVKVRVEEPTVHVYSDNEDELYKFAQTLSNGVDHSFITKVFRPKNNEVLELLKTGFAVKSRSHRHPFKAMVREGRYSSETRQQIYQILKSLGDDVQVPNHLIESLERSFDSIWGGYFYFKDPSVPVLIGLISPAFIRSIEETRQVVATK